MSCKKGLLLLVIICLADWGLSANFAPHGQLQAGINDDDEPSLHVGGAVRYNLFYTDYGGGFNENDAQFTIDTWRINFTADWKNIGLNFEYRFYPTFNTHFIKQGWLEYNASENTQIQLGVTQVPFGNLQYNSHNWWFQLPYYLGLEDDHDMGIKVTHQTGNWSIAAAYFMQAEPAGPAYGAASFGIGGSGRYSYDIIPITGGSPWDYVLGPGETPQSNQERNQWNVRTTYNFQHAGGNTEVGVSGQLKAIYNQVLDDKEWSPAVSAHLDGNYGNFNVKAQYTYYDYAARDDDNRSVDYVYMAAYGDPYAVASEGSIYTLGVSYSYDVDWGPVSNLNFYNNYSLLRKANDDFFNTHQNVLGVLVTAGQLYTYFDIASGYNHPWLTSNFGEGLAQGVEDARINTRFNINLGYYF